jgi:hypothetical protein
MTLNYKIAWHYVKGTIKRIIKHDGSLPLHQGTCDIAGVLNFHEIAGLHNLTPRQYNNLINKAQAYTDKWIKDTYFK